MEPFPATFDVNKAIACACVVCAVWCKIVCMELCATIDGHTRDAIVFATANAARLYMRRTKHSNAQKHLVVAVFTLSLRLTPPPTPNANAAANAKRKRQTPNAKRQTPNSQLLTPDAALQNWSRIEVASIH